MLSTQSFFLEYSECSQSSVQPCKALRADKCCALMNHPSAGVTTLGIGAYISLPWSAQEAESLPKRQKASRAERIHERDTRSRAVDGNQCSNEVLTAENVEVVGVSCEGDSMSRGGTAEVEEALHRQMEMQKMLQMQLEVRLKSAMSPRMHVLPIGPCSRSLL